jgi:predicted transcriptional regulator
MRTTIEMKPEHRARLLELAARRGRKGFSELVGEALEAYLNAQAGNTEKRKRARLLQGVLSTKEARSLRKVTSRIRGTWR